MTERKMIILGKSVDENGNDWKVGVPLPDFQTHAVVFGSTGSGKSTFLRNLAVQTFGLGATTCIVEPHGDLCLDILDAVPQNALDKAVYLSLDSLQPFSLPLMTIGLGAGLDVAVGAVMSVLRMAEPASWDQSARTREVLRHIIRVLLDVQGWQASLLSLDRFLTKKETKFREQILAQVSEENTRSGEYCLHEIAPALDDVKGKAGMMDSILAAHRRLEIFITDLRFRRSLALPPLGPRISLPELMKGGKMVLLPVNSAALGKQPAELISMMFMQMVATAFLSRTDRSQRQQAVVIIDEFAGMAGGASGGGEVAEIVDVILREGRKFGASQILATQSVNQLSPEVKKNLQVNTNTKIVLLVSDVDDARDAANILGSDLISDVDIRSMPKFHGYVRAMVNKSPKPPGMPKFHGYVRAMVNKSPKPPALLQMLAPMSLAEGDSVRHPYPEKPLVSDVWSKVRELAVTADDPMRPAGADAVVRFLRNVNETTWLQIVADAGAWNRYHAALLLAEPKREPDKIERAKKISRMIYGLPWWLREAHFWREAKGEYKEQSEASSPIIAEDITPETRAQAGFGE